tara:strand:- start:19 stop:522 length:504 start_codon:yes stop_codon:yes gene_type:complete
MIKSKENEVIYHVLMHHINHYQEAKKIFKIDYESQMILIAVYAHLIYQTMKPSVEEKKNEGLQWEEMFPVIKDLSKNKKKYKTKLSLFSVSQILDIPKESVRRKVALLCKKKYLEFSIKDGLNIGDVFEQTAKKIAPKDLTALVKVIDCVNENGGINKLVNKLKNFK